MATQALPVSEIKNSGDLSASIWNQRIPRALRFWMAWHLLPDALQLVTSILSNDRLEKMTKEEAVEIFPSVEKLYRATVRVLEYEQSRSSAFRWFMESWYLKMAQETDRLEDIVEALSWADQPFVDAAIKRIESLV